MADEDRLRVSYDEGELMGLPAAERVGRGIVLAVRDAIDHILSRGWDRDRDVRVVPENADGLPAVTLRGKRIFEVRVSLSSSDPLADEKDVVGIRGHWLGEVPTIGRLRRIVRLARNRA